MNKLIVDLADRSYPIYIGDSLINDPEYFKRHIPSRQVLIVSNETVAPLYLQKLRGSLDSFEVETVILKDGEEYKTLDTVSQIFDRLMELRFNRSCTLIALGGGVVGDITGFAAACYQRGVNFIQVPTTLLAQVDSSVGGKTGVNHPLGKNMIGAFYQPRAVIADTDTLRTLDDRQLAAGIAEVIKYGLIRDSEFLKWLKSNMQLMLSRDTKTLTYAIERSCQHKAEIVAADEHESGQRALLNLGHTYGHAIETGMGYGQWLHGEAVAAGMCMAARQSEKMGWISSEDCQQVSDVIASAKLPTAKPETLSGQEMLEHMQVDKKVMDGKIRLVLLKALGSAIVTADYPQDSLLATLGIH
jgi:3-dehydroquinate synthase